MENKKKNCDAHKFHKPCAFPALITKKKKSIHNENSRDARVVHQI